MQEKNEIIRLLREVDNRLKAPASIVIIGGMAAVLYYETKSATADADTWNAVPEHLSDAWSEAEEVTGITLELSQAGVADAPYAFESRTVTNLHSMAPGGRYNAGNSLFLGILRSADSKP